MRRLLLLLAPFVFTFSQAQNYDIYVSDAGNWANPPWQILKYDQNGQNPSVFINTNLAWPQDILFVEDSGFVLISNLNNGKISRFDANTGAYLSDFASGLGGPTRMKIGSDGLLYILQWNPNNKVKRYNLDGTFVDDFTSTAIPQSIGLDWDKQGNLYVSSYNGGNVHKFDTGGNFLELFISSNLAGPTNIWFNDAGDLFVSDYNATSIKQFDSAGSYLGEFITGLGQSEGVDFYPNGDILIGKGVNGSVKHYDSTGTFIKDIVSPGSGGLIRPNAVRLRETNISGINKAQKKSELSLVMPSSGRVFVLNPEVSDQILSLSITDVTGSTFKLDHRGDRIAIDKLETGIYTLRARLKDRSSVIQKILLE